MKKEYTYKYGRGTVTFSIEQDLVIVELYTKDYPVLADPATAIKEAIRNPVGSKPLQDIVKAGETVAFIVNDNTRIANSHFFMPILLDELNRVGVSDENMWIVFALGTHRLLTAAEMAGTVGSEVAKRITMYNSDCRNEMEFQYFGVTSYGTPVYFNKKVIAADHIICTGSVVHHFFAGFGGGRKAMLPGVSYYETIRRNHSLMLDANAVIGRLEGNPVYQDQIEGAEMCRPSFLLNVVLNENKEFLKVFAGDYIKAHQACCQFVDEVAGISMDKKADLVIASCGGYPKDINVYQLQKTMDNAWCVVRDGGVVIILGECIEGSGSETYEKTMKKYTTPEQVEAAVRADFQIGAHKAYAVTRLMKKAEFILVSSLPPELAQLLLFTAVKDIEEALRLAFKKLGTRPSIALMPMGSLTVPRVSSNHIAEGE